MSHFAVHPKLAQHFTLTIIKIKKKELHYSGAPPPKKK